MQALADAAKRTGRRIVLLGRSVVNQVRAAHAVGRLAWPSDLVVSPEYAATCPRDRVLVVTSGTQAERGSGLSRLATGTHPVLKVEPGDMVVFSSRIIPGNDRPVFDLYTALLRQGIELVSRTTNAAVHASGHAHRGELVRMIELVRPRAFVPVHGTLHHLLRHAELARDAGVDDVLVMENGDVIAVGPERGLAKVGRVPSGRVATAGGDPVPSEVLRERAQLGRSGVVTVAVALGPTSLAARPVVKSYGVVGPLDHDVLVRAERAVEHAVMDWLERRHAEGLEEEIRLTTRRVIESQTGARPIVVVSVVRS
jgi:ribonuclease J